MYRCPIGRALLPYLLPRKEVIQPHLQVRLPCYDFTPIASPTFADRVPQGVGCACFGYCRLSWCELRSKVNLTLLNFAPPAALQSFGTTIVRRFLALDEEAMMT